MSVHILITLYFIYIYREKKKFTHKKEISRQSQNFTELLPSACLPPEIKILSVLVKIS